MLLWSEIGDTIRVSLSADPVEEVKAGFEMLKSLGLRRRPSVSSRGTRRILKEPETRRLKNRGHLARKRKFESISLQR
jgi:hypothetical protein